MEESPPNEHKPADSQGAQAADATAQKQEEDKQVIELLRTPGLSIKYLDEPTKDRIRRFIQRTHIEKGVSLSDVSKMIGNKTSGYASWLTRQLGIHPRPFEEARLKAIKEKRRIYERRPFDGTKEDKAYLLGLRHGDISVTKPWPNAAEAIRVSTSTTHPAMAELFTNLFSPYGHISMHPRYKKDTQSYEWNLNAVLDGSFKFLDEEREAARKWIAESKTTMLEYLAGVLDAEGSITMTGYRDGTGGTILMVCYYNTDLDLLLYILKILQNLGYNPVGPYLDKPKGHKSSKYGIPHLKDYWHIQISRFAECQALLIELPIKHPEKTQRAQLALSLEYKEAWVTTREKVYRLRESIIKARNQFVQEAKTTYKSTHPQTQE
ncbi:MAG: LAGLIDADG family homing endonuclease [Thaumarchaeota archaeon]|nr:LAGLIDADG family homing endonuclease [Nitrososphaerota archaeon]